MIFETASFHIVKPCNFSCKYCYATFNDMSVRQISRENVKQILVMLYEAGVKKMTFAGGEPLLYNDISYAILIAKQIGYTTSIITNGSLLDDNFLKSHKNILDWIGISVDSVNPNTDIQIGRHQNGATIDKGKMVSYIKRYDYKLKINTVVNRHNENESLQEFIDYANPARWKIFDTLKVEGQNDRQFDLIKPSEGAFERFVARHSHPSMVVENNEAMTGSYLLIDPQGRLFENSSGKHTYSQPLYKSSVSECLSQIKLNREMFINRGGIYNW